MIGVLRINNRFINKPLAKLEKELQFRNNKENFADRKTSYMKKSEP